jgi:hypothetical protein
MKRLILLLILLLGFLSPVDSWAMMHGKGRHMRPYGGYCQGPRWGWYGAQRTVTTVEETRSLLEKFLEETDLLVGEIRDEGPFFEADILEKEEIVDILIVDKRTCRIRSKY